MNETEINNMLDLASARLKDASKLIARAKMQAGAERLRTVELACKSAEGAASLLRGEQLRNGEVTK